MSTTTRVRPRLYQSFAQLLVKATEVMLAQ